jgi:acyl-CoA dehydrogenase
MKSPIDRASEVAAVAAQYCDEVDRDARFPHEAIRAMKEHRLLGLMIAKEYGGEGASVQEIAEICTLLGQHCSATAMIFAMHQIKVGSLVTHGEGTEWHRAYMRRLASEQLLLGSATTENGTGGDLGSSVCAIERDGDRFRLRKDATVISYGMHCDAILATARRAPDAPASDQVMVVLPKDGFTLERTVEWNTLGMRGTCSEGYILNAQGSNEQIFEKPFAEIAGQSMLAMAHILWSALWYGIAVNAVSRAQSYVRAEARKKPGQQLPGALRVAEASSMLQLMKASIAASIHRFDTARKTPEDLTTVSFAIDMNNLKIGASRLCVDIVHHAMMVCGIMGYKNDTPFSLGRHMRDAMSAPIMINNDRIFGNTSNLLLVHRLDQRLAG